MSLAFTEAQLRTAQPMWLVDLDLGGVVYRFATSTVAIEHAPDTFIYDGTLSDVAWESSLEFASPDFELPSAGITVTFKIDLAKRIAQGLDFGAASASLALWIPGDDYDKRQVVVKGRVDAPSYGAIGEPVSFNIEADWLRNSQQMPAASQTIDASIWPSLDGNAEGSAYPIVIGAPGRQGFAGAPVYVVDASGPVLGLIAGHQCTGGTVTLLRVWNGGSNSSTQTATVNTAADANGNIYSWVTIGGASADGDSFFAIFDDGGGLRNPYTNIGSDYLTGAGDLLRFMLHKSGVKVDDGRCAAASAMLNFYQLDGFIGERVDVLEWIKSELLPLLPCSLRAGPDGLYPVVWRWDALESDSKASLEAGVDVHRDGLVEYVTSEVYNEITLKYRHNARYNKLKKSVTVTGDLKQKTGGFLWRTSYAVSSQTRYGVKSFEIESEIVSSRATAGRIVNWMARAYAARHKRITYTAPHRLGWLDVGDVISLSDADLSLTNQLVIIESIDWGETALTFTLLFVPDLPRDTIPLG
jgi:hypothetical protein